MNVFKLFLDDRLLGLLITAFVISVKEEGDASEARYKLQRIFPCGYDHTDARIIFLVSKREGVIVGLDVNLPGNHENRLEPKTFLTDAILASPFGALAIATDGLDVLAGESILVTFDDNARLIDVKRYVWVFTTSNCFAVEVVVCVLEQLKYESFVTNVQISRSPSKWSVSRRWKRHLMDLTFPVLNLVAPAMSASNFDADTLRRWRSHLHPPRQKSSRVLLQSS